MYLLVRMYVCALYEKLTHGGQKRLLDLLKLELQTVVSHHWVLGHKPESSARALNHYTVSPASYFNNLFFFFGGNGD